MKKTKQIALTGVLTAMYFVLSALLKIPAVGNIRLDLGYIALMVGAVYLGAVPGLLIGAIGALLESALMSQHGVSPGWILMNAIIGYLCGLVLSKAFREDRKKFLLSSFLIVPSSALLGVIFKTPIDCLITGVPLLAKIPRSASAWILDSLVMLAFGLPLCLAMKKALK